MSNEVSSHINKCKLLVNTQLTKKVKLKNKKKNGFFLFIFF